MQVRSIAIATNASSSRYDDWKQDQRDYNQRQLRREGDCDTLWGASDGFRRAGAFEKGRGKERAVLKLLQDVKTRWDSTMYMLIR